MRTSSCGNVPATTHCLPPARLTMASHGIPFTKKEVEDEPKNTATTSSTFSFMPNSDHQAIRNLDIRTTAGDHIDMSTTQGSSTSNVGLAVNVTVNCRDHSTPSGQGMGAAALGTNAGQQSSRDQDTTPTTYPTISIWEVCSGFFSDIFPWPAMMRGQPAPPGGDTDTMLGNLEPGLPVRVVRLG